MSSVGAAQIQKALEKRHAEVEAELREAQALRERHRGERQRLEHGRRKALEAAAAHILPSLAAVDVARAVRATGFTRLAEKDPLIAVDAERRRLEARRAAIEADPRHRDRELLRAPRVGTLTRQVAELEEFRAPIADVVARAEHPRLARLLEVGYDTDAYAVGFWRLSYYKDWKAGDEILERFPGKTRFAQVREEVLAARESLAVYDGRLAALRAEIEAGEALEREHAETLAAVETVALRHLQAWRGELATHLGYLEPAALAQRLAGEPDLELLLKQATGIEKKIAYLDEIVTRQVDPYHKALLAESQQIARDLRKVLHPRKRRAMTMPADRFERRFRHRPEKLRKGYARAARGYHTVHSFEHYDRGRLLEDFLWWDLMTDGRIDGDFIPEVQHFHAAHPDWSLPRDAGGDDAAAAAAAIAVDTSGPGDALVDAS